MIYSLHTKQISILYKCFKYFNQQQQNRKKVGMAVGWIDVNGLEVVTSLATFLAKKKNSVIII